MKLKEALTQKQFVVTSEIQAAIEQEPEDVLQSLSKVRGRVDGFSLSGLEIEGIVGDTINTCRLLEQNKFEPFHARPCMLVLIG